MNDYKKYINALRKCAKEHIDDITPFAYIRVSDLCSNVANLLEELEQEPCEDTISRQAAIDALDKRFNSVPMEQTTEILLLRKDLRTLPSVQPKQNWIPVSEGLPKPREDVWCNSDIGQIAGYYDEYVETWYASFGQGRDYLELTVNAWMTLPQSYKAEVRDKE